MPQTHNTVELTAWWAPHIHATRCDEDIVLLDTENDAYHHIPDPDARLRLIDIRGVAASPALIGQLSGAGLLSSMPFGGRRPLPRPPRLALQGRLSRHAIGDSVRLARMLQTPLDVTLSTSLQARAARHASAKPKTHRMEAAVGLFTLALPFVDGQGACLWRCAVLERLIDLTGGYVDWVFGVRLWPFSAHCWLQVGDAVLDDDPDRVGLYTPIMAL